MVRSSSVNQDRKHTGLRGIDHVHKNHWMQNGVKNYRAKRTIVRFRKGTFRA